MNRTFFSLSFVDDLKEEMKCWRNETRIVIDLCVGGREMINKWTAVRLMFIYIFLGWCTYMRENVIER